MCGRFAQTIQYEKIMRDFDVQEITAIVEEIQAKYNCAPGQKAMIVTSQNGQRILDYLGWGMSRVLKDGKAVQLINIRMESYKEKPSYNAIRCCIPIDGFYEWKKYEKKSTPYFFSRKDREPLILAGLCEKNAGKMQFAIITIPAAGVVADIHHRMPCMLSKNHADAWLNGEDAGFFSTKAIHDAEYDIDCYQVADMVNSVANDAPQCCEPFIDRTLFTTE